ncbi:hypothetical protein ACQKC8_12485 [Stutzerimonas stutzeri]|uniref:hypothetical protein n=1 Tax=Stutzerimonas stutzeri TaxID=316 RepID=UPI003C300CED
MSEGYTPGPWEVVGGHVYTKLGAVNRAGSRAHETDGWNIASINPWACTNADGEDEDMPVTEVMANAQLIAAAPDLLEALEMIVAEADSYTARTGKPIYNWLDQARAAIAKARGTPC